MTSAPSAPVRTGATALLDRESLDRALDEVRDEVRDEVVSCGVRR